MQTSLKKPKKGLEYSITVNTESKGLDKKVEQRLNEMSRTVKMDGFRPGKVPKNIIKQRYSKQVRQEMLGEFIQQEFYGAIAKEKFKIAGHPQFKDFKDEDSKIEFTAVFEVYPKVKLPDLSELKVDKVVSELEEKDTKKMIKKVLEQHSSWKPSNSNKKAKNGEQVIISFVGTIDGKEFKGGKMDDVPLVLGSGNMIDGFEDGIIDMKKKEVKTIKVTFPKEYHSDELKNKKAEFVITVHSVQTKILPKLDKKFIKSLGIKDGTEESFNKEIKLNMQREIKHSIQNNNRKSVFDALSKSIDFDIPKAILQQEKENTMNKTAQELQKQGVKAEDITLTADSFTEKASKRVKLGLILHELVESKKIKVSDKEVTDFIKEQASSYDSPNEAIEWYKKNQQAMSEVKSILLENKVTQLILDKAKVKEVKKSFFELTKTA